MKSIEEQILQNAKATPDKVALISGESQVTYSQLWNYCLTTVPLVLTDWPYRAEGIDTSTWKKVILSAYGVGLSWGSIACDLSNTKIYKPINQ